LGGREFATLVPLVVLSFWIGVYPTPIFRAIEQPVHKIVEAVNPGYYSVSAATVGPDAVKAR
jgi:NADH:ubiquinone oxidoreductase subunit 4 (subunit M)